MESLESPINRNLVIIAHTNGDAEDKASPYNGDAAGYELFLESLRSKVLEAHLKGATIVYRPNLGNAPNEKKKHYFTPSSNSKVRHQELATAFPFLEGLKDVDITVLPDGIGGPSYVKELDQIVNSERIQQVIVGGKYLKACVVAIARDTQSRHPDVPVFIGSDISFENGFPPIEGYNLIIHRNLC